MNEPGRPTQPELGPLPSEKVVALRDAFEQQGIPYAFGGAIALFYYRDPRSTIDIDVNVFLPPEQQAEVVEVLSAVYPIDAERVKADVEANAQTRSVWDATYVDLFFADTEFHTMMSQRIRREPFLNTEINVLSAEDLLVCKMLFDRPKDWLDVEAVVQMRSGELDRPYVESALELFVDTDDVRFDRWRRALGDT